MTELDGTKGRLDGGPSAEKEQVVVVPSSDSEDDVSDSNNSVQVTSPSPSKSRKRMHMEPNKNDSDFSLRLQNNKLIDAVFDISSNLGKMVHIQAEIVRSLKGMSDKMDLLIQTVAHKKSFEEPKNEVEAEKELGKRNSDPKCGSEEKSEETNSPKQSPQKRKITKRKKK